MDLILVQKRSLRLMAHISFRCVLCRRPTVKLDAWVRRNASARAEKVILLHAFALDFVAGAGIFHVTRQVSRAMVAARGVWRSGWWWSVAVGIVARRRAAWWRCWGRNSAVRVVLQLTLKGVKLLEKVEVRRNVRLTTTHKCKSFVQAQSFSEHQIGKGDSHRLCEKSERNSISRVNYWDLVRTYPGDASQAMNQARNILWSRFLDELDSRWKVNA